MMRSVPKIVLCLILYPFTHIFLYWHRKESHSVTAECLHVTETIINQGNRIKPVFPEYGCLILSPALFWKKNPLDFQTDPNILHTMSKYFGKAIETSPSIKGDHGHYITNVTEYQLLA